MDKTKSELETLGEWQADVFLFAKDCYEMLPAEAQDDLLNKTFRKKDSFGIEREVVLFSQEGRLLHPDLSFYDGWMFKNQSREAFKQYNGKRFTWQQTVFLEAYNRALNTFGKNGYNEALRWITARSGHGIGKTSSMSIMAIHFLICFPGAQIGMTANTEQQVEDVFMKEFYVWKRKLPEGLREGLSQTTDHIKVEDSEDWFLRAQVARVEKPEALAGLHGEFILILVDEASGVPDKVIETMKGALTGDNFVVIYVGNPTRNEGEFYDSHKKGARFTKLHFSSRHSPIVKEGYVKKWEEDYPPNGDRSSDEVLVRVDGEFAGVGEMEEGGWIPLFTNVTILFEPLGEQIINHGIIGVDPAGKGRDSSIITVRDNVYLKEVLNEQTSSEPDLARKIETIRDAYNCSSNDIGIEAFGIGAIVVANVQSKIGENVTAILTDKPRDEVKDKYHTYRSELGWRFREWAAKGGIIVTNNERGWRNELEKIKYKRDAQGRIMLMDKVQFKRLYGFSPDRFDAACMTFFKDEAERPVMLTKQELENKELYEWIKRQNEANNPKEPNYSSF